MDGNGFTNKEILVRLEAKVDKVLDNHEQRLTVVERFQARLVGAGKLIGSAALIATPIVAILYH